MTHISMTNLSTVEHAIRWWLQGLAYLVPAAMRSRACALPAHLRIRRDGSSLVFEFCDADGAALESHATDAAATLDEPTLRHWLTRRYTETMPVVLRLGDDEILTKSLKLPLAAAPRLRELLTFEIDRQTPFTPEQIYFDYRIDGRGDNNQRLEVTLVAVRRTLIDELQAKLQALDLRPNIIDAQRCTFAATGINLSPWQTAAPERRNSTRQLLLLYVIMFGLLALVVYVPANRTASALSAARAELKALASSTKQLEALRKTHDAKLAEINFFHTQREARTRSIDVLGALTTLLPDDTWLSRLDVRPSQVELRGESAEASKLVSLLEQSSYFHGAEFSSPVTRNNATSKDRFFLSASVVKPE